MMLSQQSILIATSRFRVYVSLEFYANAKYDISNYTCSGNISHNWKLQGMFIET